jgi:hypothetical protein
MTLLAAGSLAAFAPHHSTSVGAFRDVIGGFYAWYIEACPQGLAFPLHTPGKRPGLVLTGEVLVHQRIETRIPRSPLAHGGALRTHVAQSLELSVDACPKARNACLYTLREPFGWADQMCQATLP